MENYQSNQHPDNTVLLDYLDSSCHAEDSRHIQQCAHCLNELEQICETRAHLRQLPAHQPAEHVWNNIQAELAPRATPARTLKWIAAAASIFLVVALMLPSLRQKNTLPDQQFASLLQESRQLESALAYLDRQPSVLKLGIAGQITRYRDSIAAIDLALNEYSLEDSDANIRSSLMKERIRLMRALVTQQAQPLVASYQAF